MSNSRTFKRGDRVYCSAKSGLGGAGEVTGQDEAFVYVRLDADAKVCPYLPGHVDELRLAKESA